MGLKPVVLSDGWSWASAKGRAALPRFSLKGVGPPSFSLSPQPHFLQEATYMIVSWGCTPAWMQLSFLVVGILFWHWNRERAAV